MYWADKIAFELIKKNPKQKKFVLASGITPSGIVHIGNFRDIITSDLVSRSLKAKGYKVNMIFSWDNYDRLRKVPINVPESFFQYLGQPLTEIPDPNNIYSSYAEQFQIELEEVLPKLGINIQFIDQSKMYKSNIYFPKIKIAMQKRRQIAKILAEFRTQGMTKKEIDNYYPLQVYCKKCKSSMQTKIISYDEENILNYYCGCSNKETVDISKENIGKLSWKIDWAMRWSFEKVDFEPGGSDHSSPGGSFDISQKISKEIFERASPYYQGYSFIGIEGAFKMSSSKGTGITPKELLKIYEPKLLRWLFARTLPKKSFTLFFNSEIIRQYNEFDKKVSLFHQQKLKPNQKREIELSSIKTGVDPKEGGISFRQVSSFGQIAQGNFKEFKIICERMGLKLKNKKEIAERLEKSYNWIRDYMPENKISLRSDQNIKYYNNLSTLEKAEIALLTKEIKGNWSLKDLTALVYEIPNNKKFDNDKKKEAQRQFFKNVYKMLISQETGPRLPTFLLAIGQEKIKKLLIIKRPVA